MTENINEQEYKIIYNEKLTVKITSEVVTSMHVIRALMQCPEFIIFTKNVKKFDMLAFKGVDCKKFDFSTATSLKRIGKKCFKNAKNIHWTDVLENAEQEDNSFEDAVIIGKDINQEFGL